MESLNRMYFWVEIEKNGVFWNGFPLLKLYFTFYVHLMKMETSNSDVDRNKGFQLFSDLYAKRYPMVCLWYVGCQNTELPFIKEDKIFYRVHLIL